MKPLKYFTRVAQILAILFVFLTIFACNLQRSEITDSEIVSFDPDIPIPFSDIKEQVLDPHCNNCHGEETGNEGNVNLETYDNVQNQIEDIIRTTINSTYMPKGKSLETTLKQMLKVWIEQGAPEFSE